jgi:hypothetical protein
VVYFPNFVANGCLLRSTCVIDIWSRDVNISRLRTGRSITGRVMFVRRHRSSTLVKKKLIISERQSQKCSDCYTATEGKSEF